MIGHGNQLLSDGVWNYTYDADGDLIEKVGLSTGPDKNLTWKYTYNTANEMTSAVETKSGTTIATVVYDYDVFGERIEEDSTVAPQRLRSRGSRTTDQTYGQT